VIFWPKYPGDGKHTFGFGRFSSASNMHFQSKLREVGIDEIQSYQYLVSTLKCERSVIYVKDFVSGIMMFWTKYPLMFWPKYPGGGEIKFGFGRFSSASNLHFQSRLREVGIDEIQSYHYLVSTFKHERSVIYVNGV